MNWTPEEARRQLAKHATSGKAATPSKFKNVRVVIDGEKFDSKAEAAYWQQLKLREKAGEITDLQRQVRFPLYAAITDYLGIEAIGGMVAVSEYVADFIWREHVALVVADKKGKRTAMYLLKRKWLELQQGILIREV